MRDGVLQAKVTAPPVDGKANKALCRLIAKRVGVAPSRVSVVRGEKSREKVVRVERSTKRKSKPLSEEKSRMAEDTEGKTTSSASRISADVAVVGAGLAGLQRRAQAGGGRP